MSGRDGRDARWITFNWRSYIYALSAKFNECIARHQSATVWFPRDPQKGLSSRQSDVQGAEIRVVSYLPASNAQKEAQDIGLLLLLKLFHVLEYVSRMTDPTTMGLGSHLERTHIDLAGGLVEWVVVVS